MLFYLIDCYQGAPILARFFADEAEARQAAETHALGDEGIDYVIAVLDDGRGAFDDAA